MKLWTMTWTAFVMVFCFAVAAYADPVGEDKTEAVKIQAIVEAEAKLQPLEANIKTIFDETLKDRRIQYSEMKKLDAAIEKYETELKAVNQHMAIYGYARESRAYQPAIELNKLYFPGYFFLSDGRWHQNEMRLLAAKEGVDIQSIAVSPLTGFCLVLLGCAIIAFFVCTRKESLPAFILMLAFVIMALVTAICL